MGVEPPRAVTEAEAYRLAVARYSVFAASPVGVRVAAPMGGGSVVVDAVVDYRVRRAAGGYRLSDGAGGVVVWDVTGLAVAPGEGDVGAVPAVGWSPRGFTGDPLDTALHLVLELGSDRPDNARLLAQQSPRWLRAEVVDGERFDVFAGPRPLTAGDSGSSRLTYWVGAQGRLRRATMRLAGVGVLVTVDFTGPAGRPVPSTPWG